MATANAAWKLCLACGTGSGVSASGLKTGFSPRARAAIISLRVFTDAFTPRTMSGMNAMSANAPTIATAILMDWPTMELGIMKMSSARFTAVTRAAAKRLNSLLEARTTAGPPPMRCGSR